MSPFAKTKCTKCGAIKSHHLGGWGFYGNETTICFCGCEYQNVENCIEDILDRDDPPMSSSKNFLDEFSTGEIDYEVRNRLAKFSTEELEEELRRRKG